MTEPNCGDTQGLCKEHQACVSGVDNFICIDECGYKDGERDIINGGTFCVNTNLTCIEGICSIECDENTDVFCPDQETQSCVNNRCVYKCGEEDGIYCETIDDIPRGCLNGTCENYCGEGGAYCPIPDQLCKTFNDSEDICMYDCGGEHEGYCSEINTVCALTGLGYNCVDICTSDSQCNANETCFISEIDNIPFNPTTGYCLVNCAEEGGNYCPESEICIDKECIVRCGMVDGYCSEPQECFESDEGWSCSPPCGITVGFCNEGQLCQVVTINNHECVDICGERQGPCEDPQSLCVFNGETFTCEKICGVDGTGPCPGNQLCIPNNNNHICVDQCGDVMGPCYRPDDVCILTGCGATNSCPTPYACIPGCNDTTNGPCSNPDQLCIERELVSGVFYECEDKCGIDNNEGPCEDPNHECIQSQSTQQWFCTAPCGARQGECPGRFDICVPDQVYGYSCQEECGHDYGPCRDPKQVCQHQAPIYVCMDDIPVKNTVLIATLVSLIALFFLLLIVLGFAKFGDNRTFGMMVYPDWYTPYITMGLQ